MKHSDFRIGVEFLASAGFRWRCTDVGTRTIVAIRLDHDNPDWFQGPPYIADEVVFDEAEMKHCHLSMDDALRAAVGAADEGLHPGYPTEVVAHMAKAWHAHYPHPGVLRFARRRGDGEILDAYAGRKQDKRWIVALYLPYTGVYEEMPEDDFIALPRASRQDYRRRALRANRKNAR